MNKSLITLTISTVALATTLTAFAAGPKPKLSASKAAASATKKIPGRVVSTKYEFEDGVWKYAVVVQAKKGGMYEVEVNSTTGKVLDTEKTTAAEEKSEAKADAAAVAKARK